MRTVVAFLRDTADTDVVAFLGQIYPFQHGPPWIYDIAGDPCLYIELYSDYREELEPEDWQNLLTALGAEPSVGVAAHVSGRHPGDEQVREFILNILTRFRGVANDDFIAHYWTTEEIRSNMKVEGRGFFDYKRSLKP